MNNKQCAIVSSWVIVCKVREEVDNDLGQFAYAGKPAFECNSLIVVGAVGNARSRVPVDSVACF